MPRRNHRPDVVGLGMETIPGLDVAPTPVGLGVRGTLGPERRGAGRPPKPVERLGDRPVWSAYRGRPLACYEGVRLSHEAAKNGAATPGHATHARYRRKFRKEEHLLCGPCAAVQHAADGLTSPLPTTTRGVR